MVLVDTSAWIDFFRGSGSCAAPVDALLVSGEAALCGPIVTELRRGFGSPAERRRVMSLLDACHDLPEPARLWQEAGDLGYAIRRRGATVKSLDLLIATYALAAAVPLLTRDADFRIIRAAGIPLDLVELP
ncbi:MAG: PIN domain-containing protein [Myxococcales bacterium]|nr:PIN domain-containing protein [Myxococcales bacterium]